jgi:hypothetical protein
MNIEQYRWSEGQGWEPEPPSSPGLGCQLVFLFGSTRALHERRIFDSVRQTYPHAHLIGCSTAGEIYGTQVSDDSLVITAVHFEHTRLQAAQRTIGDAESSFQVGADLADLLEREGLVHVFVLSEGLKVNGSELVHGLTSRLPSGVNVTGGLAGDGERFTQTFVISDGPPMCGTVAVVGFYSDRLRVGYSSLGGWDAFGTERLITRADGNILYELDGKSALALYKRYLGPHAQGLPATGLLFPLSLRTSTPDTAVVRTILAIDEASQSMTFAGDIPVGAYARFMKANFDRLIDGAEDAASTSTVALGAAAPDLAILISCVGRKLVLKQRIEEEVESVREIMGQRTILAGFYSYGEISPFTTGAKCQLHNQTMAITTFSEK